MAVEWGLAEEIFSVKIFFFALTPVFSGLFLQYSLIMTLKYGILSQSTAVFPQSVENVVNTRSSMGKKKYRHIPWNRYNLEKYRDINFWSYRPALDTSP